MFLLAACAQFRKKKKLNGPESITIVTLFIKVVKLEGTQGLSPSTDPIQRHPNPMAEGTVPVLPELQHWGCAHRPLGQSLSFTPRSISSRQLSSCSHPPVCTYIQGHSIPSTESGTALFTLVRLVTAQLFNVSRSLRKASPPLKESAAPPSLCIICKFT